MRTMILIALVSVLAGAAYGQGCGSCQTPPGQRTCGTGGATDGYEVMVSELASTTVASIARTGPYDGVGAALGEVFAWTAAKEVPVMGIPFGMYLDDPATVPAESTRYEVGVPVPAGTEGDEAVTVKSWGGMTVARTLFTGPYDGMKPGYEALERWISANGYRIAGPAVEFYLNSPETVPAESLMTQIALVVEKQAER